MDIETARFIKSSASHLQCPEPLKPEYAFIGRSNVGKSSLINMIAGNKKLAKTSSTPGKTQLINHFLVNDAWFLVDLPGYGYAKTSRKNREVWEKMIYGYLRNRQNLVTTFILIDSRHEPLRNDIDFISWFGTEDRPFILLFTKSDKVAQSKLEQTLASYRLVLSQWWEEMPFSVVTSARNRTGRDRILTLIDSLNLQYSGH